MHPLKLKNSKFKLVIPMILVMLSCKKGNIYFDDKEIIRRLSLEKSPAIKYEKDINGDLIYIKSTYDNDVFDTKIVYNEINNEKHVKYILSYKEDIRFGHHFMFYNNGRLAAYGFNIGNGNSSSYVVKFGHKGIPIQTEGTPLVFHQNNGKKIQIFFSKILYDSLEVQLCTDLSNFKKIKLSNSTVQPGMMETILPITTKNPIFKMRAFRNKEVKEYLDTISINTKH